MDNNIALTSEERRWIEDRRASQVVGESENARVKRLMAVNPQSWDKDDVDLVRKQINAALASAGE